MELADPKLTDEQRAVKKYEIMKRLSERQDEQEEEIQKIEEFITHCGMPADDMETDERRCDFDKFVKLITLDTLTYNFRTIGNYIISILSPLAVLSTSLNAVQNSISNILLRKLPRTAMSSLKLKAKSISTSK